MAQPGLAPSPAAAARLSVLPAAAVLVPVLRDLRDAHGR